MIGDLQAPFYQSILVFNHWQGECINAHGENKDNDIVLRLKSTIQCLQ